MAFPQTRTRTDHAIRIRVNGKTIGQIQDWNPQQSRTVTPTYELNSATSGEVFENVPGNITGLSITVNRFDLFDSKMEGVWGVGYDLTMLTNQTSSIEVKEVWRATEFSPREAYTYKGCWFSSLGRTHSANGDRITKVNATMMYVSKKKTS